jgi:hypothetical protein
MTRAPLLLALLLTLAATPACRRVRFEDSTLSKKQVRYRIGELPEAWHRVFVEGNDLAFSEDNTGRALSVNSTCQGHDDPPLPVLTRHLLMGFTESREVSKELIALDGREALRSRHTAKLDGVPVELELVVLKKDGCVFDFTYVAPPGQAQARMPDFDALIAGFHTGPGP